MANTKAQEFFRSTIKCITVHIVSKESRSSPSQMFFKIGVLKHFANFTGKHLCWSLFFKKRLWHRCFPVNFAKFLRTYTVGASERNIFSHVKDLNFKNSYRFKVPLALESNFIQKMLFNVFTNQIN